MLELYFIVTLLLTTALVFTILLQFIRKKSITKYLKILSSTLFIYILLWTVFYFKIEIQPITFGEDICFDDWCATITSFDRLENLGNKKAAGHFFVLSIKMTNKARGISQKPCQPRVQIMDDLGHTWSSSTAGQKAFENMQGIQIPIDQNLELHQSLQTKIVFDIPYKATGLKAIIEEGPQFMSKIILQGNKKVFELK